jgi:hypothetical protein
MINLIYVTKTFLNLIMYSFGLLSTDCLSQEKKHYQLKNHFRFRVGNEIVFDLK